MGEKNQNVLLIDDDDLVVLAFRECLLRAGCRVDAATRLGEARTILSNGAYTAIWMDLQLTGSSTGQCLDFLKLVRAAFPAMLIVAVSAYASPIVEGQALACGADRFIHKPFDLRVIAKTLSKIIGCVSADACSELAEARS